MSFQPQAWSPSLGSSAENLPGTYEGFSQLRVLRMPPVFGELRKAYTGFAVLCAGSANQPLSPRLSVSYRKRNHVPDIFKALLGLQIVYQEELSAPGGTLKSRLCANASDRAREAGCELP